MILLEDEEMQQAISTAISDWALGEYKDGWGEDAMAQDNYFVIRKSQLKKVAEWLMADCIEHPLIPNGIPITFSRIECPKCLQVLLKEVE